MKNVKRYLIFLVGLYINSVGISLITLASLGTSPGTGIPYVLSLGLSPSLGQFTIVFNFLLIILQIILRRKEFEKIQYLQIAASILFGYFIDFSRGLLSWIMPITLLEKLIVLLLGCVILGLGVFSEVGANVIMLPGEGFVKAVSIALKKEFGITKVWIDASMTMIALLISLFMFHGIRGVGTGTIIAALITGLIANFFTKLLGPVMQKFISEKTGDDGREEWEGSLKSRLLLPLGASTAAGLPKSEKSLRKNWESNIMTVNWSIW